MGGFVMGIACEFGCPQTAPQVSRAVKQTPYGALLPSVRSGSALASSAALFQPVAGVPSHDGWSGSLLKRGAGNAAFKLRFFVLPRDTNRLLWYEDERSWQSSPPHRAVQIVGVGEAISASGEHRFCFDVWAKELDAGSKARGGVLTRMLRRKGSQPMEASIARCRLVRGSVGMAARAEELLTSARSG